MNQPLEPRNNIRRVATAHLLFLGDLNRFKVKFLASAVKQLMQEQRPDRGSNEGLIQQTEDQVEKIKQ